MPITRDRPAGIYYEHPDWFRPLFAELDRRGVPYERLHADRHHYDPAVAESRHSVVLNRMSPSADARGRGHAISYTLQYLAHLERAGMRVINGHDAFLIEVSKARQLSLLQRLGVPYPRARVIQRAVDAPAAADGLRFPIVVKPNVGGSGAGIRRFESPTDLCAAVEAADLDTGLDGTALVQELIPAEGSRIVRVEVLGGRYLYAIRVYAAADSFNLCPADICRTTDGASLDRPACPADAPNHDIEVEAYSPPAERVRQVERIMAAAGIEVGGVEYLTDARDGQTYFYDINALSNFVADAPRVVGFDPFARLATYLEAEAR